MMASALQRQSLTAATGAFHPQGLKIFIVQSFTEKGFQALF